MPRIIEILIAGVIGAVVAATATLLPLDSLVSDEQADQMALTVRLPGYTYRASAVTVPADDRVRVELFVPAAAAGGPELDERFDVAFGLPPDIDPIQGSGRIIDAGTGAVEGGDVAIDVLLGEASVPLTILGSDRDRIIGLDVSLDVADPDDPSAAPHTITATLGDRVGTAEIIADRADVPRARTAPDDSSWYRTYPDVTWDAADVEGIVFADRTHPILSFTADPVDLTDHANEEDADYVDGGLLLYPGDSFVAKLTIDNLSEDENNAPYYDGPTVARDVAVMLMIPEGVRADRHVIHSWIRATNAAHPTGDSTSRVTAADATVDVVGGGELVVVDDPTYGTGDLVGDSVLAFLRHSPTMLWPAATRVGRSWSEAEPRPEGEEGPDVSAYGNTNYVGSASLFELRVRVAVQTPERDSAAD